MLSGHHSPLKIAMGKTMRLLSKFTTLSEPNREMIIPINISGNDNNGTRNKRPIKWNQLIVSWFTKIPVIISAKTESIFNDRKTINIDR